MFFLRPPARSKLYAVRESYQSHRSRSPSFIVDPDSDDVLCWVPSELSTAEAEINLSNTFPGATVALKRRN